MSTSEQSDESVSAERARLIGEAERRADDQRRTWPYTILHALTMIAFGLAPLVPGSDRLFGATRAADGLAFVAPGIVSMLVCVRLYQRAGAGSHAYQLADGVEALLFYDAVLAFAYRSGLSWSVLWVLPPFTASYWASTKPFRGRIYTAIIVGSHLLLALALLARGSPDAAWAAIAVGAAAWLTFTAVARGGLRNLRLEAERNVTTTRLSETLLDRERERLARALDDSVGRELTALVGELESHAGDERTEAAGTVAAEARSALTELDRIVRSRSSGAEQTLAELARSIEMKCRPLCVGIAFDQSLRVDRSGAQPLSPRRALALMRVSQELVRNAVTHGRAGAVQVELAHDGASLRLHVRDDGRGLGADAFAGAAGGLRNARQWLAEEGGTLELVPRDAAVAGTELRATIVVTPRAG